MTNRSSVPQTKSNPFGFVLSQGCDQTPAGFETYALADWTLATGPNITCTRLALDGWSGAWLLSLLPPEAPKTAPPRIEDIDSLVVGGFVLILQSGSELEIRQDACGMMPVVFAPKARVVAACPSLIAAEPYCDARTALTQTTDTFFAFGLTAKPGVHRLLPNHALTVSNFEIRRIWNIDALETNTTPEAVAAPILTHLQKALQRLDAAGPLLLPLTAGRDSRVLAACLDRQSRVTAYTSVLDSAASWDSAIAAKIARRLDLSYESRYFRRPSDSERQHWLQGVGYSVGGRVSTEFVTARRDPGAWLVNGFCGEVGRNFYFDVGDRSPDGLLDTIGCARLPEARAAAEAWLRPLADLSPRQLADLLYIEARLGCWAGPQMIAPTPPVRGRIAPFGQRAIVEAMLRVPGDLRYKDRVPQALLAHQNGCLLRHRFDPHGKRDVLRVGLANARLYGIAARI